jgi:hypothetical protein
LPCFIIMFPQISFLTHKQKGLVDGFNLLA